MLIPQFFWSKRVRNNNVLIFVLCIFINIGMWFERFVIIATSLARSFLPSAWSYYHPTRYDIGLFVGTIGMFFTLFLLFFRFLPVDRDERGQGRIARGSRWRPGSKGGHH